MIGRDSGLYDPCLYVYIYITRERERERERESWYQLITSNIIVTMVDKVLPNSPRPTEGV